MRTLDKLLSEITPEMEEKVFKDMMKLLPQKEQHEIYLEQLYKETPIWAKQLLTERDYEKMYGSGWSEFLQRDLNNPDLGLNWCFDGAVYHLPKTVKLNILKKEWKFLGLDEKQELEKHYVKLISNPVYED